jgi:hypothetical protein
VSEATYEAALARELRTLVCSGDGDPNYMFRRVSRNQALYILRGISSNDRLAATGPQAAALIESVMGKDCGVSSSLTDDDKARLRQIKRDAMDKVGDP